MVQKVLLGFTNFFSSHFSTFITLQLLHQVPYFGTCLSSYFAIKSISNYQCKKLPLLLHQKCCWYWPLEYLARYIRVPKRGTVDVAVGVGVWFSTKKLSTAGKGHISEPVQPDTAWEFQLSHPIRNKIFFYKTF